MQDWLFTQDINITVWHQLYSLYICVSVFSVYTMDSMDGYWIVIQVQGQNANGGITEGDRYEKKKT